MKIARYWKILLPFTVVTTLVGAAALWFTWPSISFQFALHQLEGEPSSDEDWNFRLNTFDDGIPSHSVAEFYLKGSRRLAELDSRAEAYTFEDHMGYRGCVTITQHSDNYEYVGVFGGNDNDSLSMGRASGTFPPERYLNLKQIPTMQLPPGIIRPWENQKSDPKVTPEP